MKFQDNAGAGLKPAPTIGMVSLGCPKNLVDSEGILAEFVKKGYKVIDVVSDADVAIVNTCAFIEDAKRESIDAILDLVQLKKEGRIKKIIVSGCLPQRYEKALREEMAEIDVFHGVREFSEADPDDRVLITLRHYAYIKISEGCDNRCSYCVISKIRGSYKSRNQEAILKEIDTLYKNSKGALKEINLISQDLTYYGMDLYGKLSLPVLLGRINKNIKWVRLLYMHPAHFTDDLINMIRDNAQICKYIDLPVQHINDRILAKMGRKVTKKQILNLIAKLRENIPEIAIRSSLIVGMPGETEKEFKELLEFIKDIKFERLGIFTYSREEDTPAYNFKGQISDKIKKERFDEAMKLQQDVAKQVNARFLGRVLEVLIDDKNVGAGFKPAPTYVGRTYADAPEVDGQVFVKCGGGVTPPPQVGEFVNAKIVDTMEYDLVGEVRQN